MYCPHVVSVINIHQNTPHLTILHGVMLQALTGQSVQRRGDIEEATATLYIPLSVHAVNAAGESVTLHAEGSDPDGDALAYDWFRYSEADTCDAEVELAADGAACTVNVPADAKPGDTIHVIVRVRDDADGKRDGYMVAYRRVVLTVA